MLLLHIGVDRFSIAYQNQSVWHQLLDRVRVLCSILFVFATASTVNGQWLTWGIYAIGLLSLILISQVTWLTLFKRVAIEFLFLASILVGTLFHQQGEVLWQWGEISITTGGMTVLGSVLCKSLLCLLMLNLLVLTTPMPKLIQALAELKMPALLIAILSSMYRYIHLLNSEFASLQQAAIARNLMGHSQWQRLVIGHMIGGLFIRTYDRGDRIYQAMQSRGYEGLPPVRPVQKLRSCDRLFLIGAIFWLGLGQRVGLL